MDRSVLARARSRAAIEEARVALATIKAESQSAMLKAGAELERCNGPYLGSYSR